MEKFLNLLLGEQDLPTYAAYFVFALIGAIISLRLKAKKRNKLNPETPPRFSFSFMVHDNFMRLLIGFLLAFISFRFSTEMLGTELTVWSAMLIGASTDRIAGLFKSFQDKARNN